MRFELNVNYRFSPDRTTEEAIDHLRDVCASADEIVIERNFENIRLTSEQVAEFDYRPGQCKKAYRMVVVRKNLSVEKGETVLFDDIRYFWGNDMRFLEQF